jgi:hypothetical protein
MPFRTGGGGDVQAAGTGRIASTAASVICACRLITLPSALGWTRLLAKYTNRSSSGSIHSDTPVYPPWPKARAEK